MAAKGVIGLKEWIEKEGVQTVSKVLRVDESTVRHWRRGWVLPKATQMQKIVAITKGAVSYASMIETHLAPSNKKNRFRG